MKVKNDHRSEFSNLSNWKEEAWKESGLQRDSNPWPVTFYHPRPTDFEENTEGLWTGYHWTVSNIFFLLHDSENDLYNVLKTYEWIWNKAACIFLFLLNRVTKFKVLS